MSVWIRAAGYDDDIVRALTQRDARVFGAASLVSLAVPLIVAVGVGYGAGLVIGAFAAVAIGVAAGLFLLNLLRLHHAGSGYSLHAPIEQIDAWRPARSAVVVLCVLGALMSQPLVLLAQKPLVDDAVAAAVRDARALRSQLTRSPLAGSQIDERNGARQLVPDDGLILRARLTYEHHLGLSLLLTFVFSLLIAGPALLRRGQARAVRAYERERWIRERMFVDDEYAEAQDVIENLLHDLPGFRAPLPTHSLDPPYNTRPLLFGFDPSTLVKEGVRYTRREPDLPPERVPRAPAAQAPIASPPSPPPASPTPSASTTAVDNTPPLSIADLDDASHDDARTPPVPAFFDVGRLPMARARAHIDLVAPFVVQYTGRPEADVRALLRVAPDDARVHSLFSEWKKLPTILLHDAGFALDAGLAPVLALIVARPIVDVERRLRAAPRERRLSGVFAAELARRLLPKKNGA